MKKRFMSKKDYQAFRSYGHPIPIKKGERCWKPIVPKVLYVIAPAGRPDEESEVEVRDE